MIRRAAVIFALATMTLSASTAHADERRPEFHGTISTLDAATRELMTGRSWRPGCPVPLRDLRLLRMTYWGFDRRAHRGRMVVHRWYANEIVRAFHRLYDERFPIRSMVLVDRFGADDKRSMRADNTSGFNCRYRAGVCCRWSQHAYGRAIDIDPVENPYVWSGGFSPPNGRRFLDRSMHRRGMIHHHDAVWWAFHAVGWSWGGDWRTEKDYQHFSANGH
jgi:D-alanyl-D-alanine carboxypeptidase